MTAALNADVVVIGCGAGNLSAAHAACDAGPDTLVLETAPESERGGNTTFSGGSPETARNGIEDFPLLHPDLSAEELSQYGVPP